MPSGFAVGMLGDSNSVERDGKSIKTKTTAHTHPYTLMLLTFRKVNGYMEVRILSGVPLED
jgi:hypothetical protein